MGLKTWVLRRFMGLARLDFLDVFVGLAGAILPYIANEAAKLPRDADRGSDERADQRGG